MASFSSAVDFSCSITRRDVTPAATGFSVGDATNEMIEVVTTSGTRLRYYPMSTSYGWLTAGIDTTKLPYISRTVADDRYIPLKVVQAYFSEYLRSSRNQFLFGRPPMRGYYVTTKEVRLLNRFISHDYAKKFGLSRFSLKDLVVPVVDFVDFYEGLTTKPSCCSPACGQETAARCVGEPVVGGWSQVNNTIVPYVVRNNVKLVPLLVVRYAAGLLCDVDVPCLDARPDECRYLNKLCTNERLDFEFPAKTKLIELFLVPTLSKTCITIVELPKDEPMRHAKFVYNCATRRSVFVAASARNNGTPRSNLRRRASRKRTLPVVDAPASKRNVQPETDQDKPAPPEHPTTAPSSHCEFQVTSSLTCTDDSPPVGTLEPAAIYPQHGIHNVFPYQASPRQDLASLMQCSNQPFAIGPVPADAAMQQQQQQQQQTNQITSVSPSKDEALEPTLQACRTPEMPERGMAMTAPLFVVIQESPTMPTTTPTMPLTTLEMPAATYTMPTTTDAVPSTTSPMHATAYPMYVTSPATPATAPPMQVATPPMPATTLTMATSANALPALTGSALTGPAPEPMSSTPERPAPFELNQNKLCVESAIGPKGRKSCLTRTMADSSLTTWLRTEPLPVCDPNLSGFNHQFSELL